MLFICCCYWRRKNIQKSKVISGTAVGVDETAKTASDVLANGNEKENKKKERSLSLLESLIRKLKSTANRSDRAFASFRTQKSAYRRGKTAPVDNGIDCAMEEGRNVGGGTTEVNGRREAEDSSPSVLIINHQPVTINIQVTISTDDRMSSMQISSVVDNNHLHPSSSLPKTKLQPHLYRDLSGLGDSIAVSTASLSVINPQPTEKCISSERNRTHPSSERSQIQLVEPVQIPMSMTATIASVEQKEESTRSRVSILEESQAHDSAVMETIPTDSVHNADTFNPHHATQKLSSSARQASMRGTASGKRGRAETEMPALVRGPSRGS